MGIFSRVRKQFKKPMLFGAFAGLLLGSLIFVFAGDAKGVSFPGTTQYCDTNSVIRCGALDSATLISKYNATPSVQNIYSDPLFGMNSSEMQSFAVNAVAGRITKSGNVYVGDTLVATNAITAGRHNKTGSTYHNHNATVFYSRPPSVSFIVDSQPAYVLMQNGKFAFAVIASCGNPVVATPKTPSYSLTKEVQKQGAYTWSKSVSVNPGTTVNYKVTVTNTGELPLTNVVVKDQLPAHVTYTANTLLRDGVAADSGQFFGSGYTVPSIAVGATTTFTFSAVVGASDTLEKCTNETLTNTAASSNPVGNKSDTATVNKQCLPKPNFVCNSLTAANAGSRTDFTFTLSALLENVQLKTVTYTVTDAKGNIVDTISAHDLKTVNYSQDKEGKYTVKSVIVVTVNGVDKTAPGTCEATFTVKPVPAVPKFACDAFSVTSINGTKVAFVLSYTADGGAKLTAVNVAWGDQTNNNLALNKLTDITHMYAKTGKYTAVATLSFVIGDKTDDVKSVTCEAPVNIPEKPVPPVLVNTGPSSMIGMFAAATIAGSVAYRFVWLRRFDS